MKVRMQGRFRQQLRTGKDSSLTPSPGASSCPRSSPLASGPPRGWDCPAVPGSSDPSRRVRGVLPPAPNSLCVDPSWSLSRPDPALRDQTQPQGDSPPPPPGLQPTGEVLLGRTLRERMALVSPQGSQA